MKTQHRKMDASALAPLLLFTIFTLCVIFVLLIGAHIYESSVSRGQRSYDQRTVAHYLSNRVRQIDCSDAWFVGDFHEAQPLTEGNTLFFREVLQGEVYYTRVYCHNGYLYELCSIAGKGFDPSDGEKILALDALHFRAEDHLLQIQYQYTNGESDELFLHLHNGTVVEP